MSATVSIVAAVSRNGVIGVGGGLPWRIPADLRRFRALTLGHSVVMGRRTFDSIGKALEGRRNIVVTRNASFRPAGAEVANSLESALALASAGGGKGQGDEIFIIGGGEIYGLAMKLGIVDRMHITEVDIAVEGGDAFFPRFVVKDQWEEKSREIATPLRDDTGSHQVDFVVYERVNRGASARKENL